MEPVRLGQHQSTSLLREIVVREVKFDDTSKQVTLSLPASKTDLGLHMSLNLSLALNFSLVPRCLSVLVIAAKDLIGRWRTQGSRLRMHWPSRCR